MRILHFALTLTFFCTVSDFSASAQTNWNEALKKSVFAKDDLSKLQSGQILGRRNSLEANGIMSVQNCFIVPNDPIHVAAVILSWNPTSYSELGVVKHSQVTRPPSPENFSKLAFDPSQSYIKAFLDKSAQQGPNGGSLNVSKAESAKLAAANQGPNAEALAWRDILIERAANYQATGISQAPPYETSNGKVSLPAAIQKLVGQIPGITQNFSTLLAVTFNNPNGLKQAESFYWELLKVQREGTLLLGAMFQVNDPSGKIQISDFQYYVSGSFSSALILYDLIPVVSNGQPATLVWRSDFVFIPSIISGSGMERMATENILLLEVQKSIKRLQKDTS